MADNNPIKYSDLIQEDDSIKKLVDQLEQANSKIADLEEKIKELTDTAKKMKSGFADVSGATKEGREATEKMAGAVEDLGKSFEELRDEYIKTRAEQNSQNKMLREMIKVKELEIKMTESAAGSYDQLSAMYSVMKLRLNEMSEAERKNTEAGRELEASAKAIYEEMNRLQEATGKYSLNVGKYEKSIISALSPTNKFGNTIIFISKAAKSAGGVMQAVGAQIKAFTAAMMANPIIAIATAILVALMLVKKGIDTFKRGIDSSAEATANFQKLIAPLKMVMNALGVVLQQVVNFTLKLAGAFMDVAMSISKMLEKLPFVGKTFKIANEQTERYIELAKMRRQLEQDENKALLKNAQLSAHVADLREKAADKENYTAQERLAFLKEAGDAELEIMQNTIELADLRLKIFKEENKYGEMSVAQERELAELEVARIKALEDFKNAQRTITRAQQSAIKEIKSDEKAAHDERMRQAKEYQAMLKEQQDKLREAIRQNQDITTSLLKDGLEKQRIIINQSYDRQIEDLKRRLAEEQNLTIEARETINDTIVKLEQRRIQEIEKANEDYAMALIDKEIEALQSIQKGIELRLAVVRKGSQEEMDIRLEALENQRQIEIEQNKRIATELRQDEAAINAKYNDMILRERDSLMKQQAQLSLDIQQDYLQSEFDLLRKTEGEKTRFRLKAEQERLQQLLDLNEKSAQKLSDIEVKTIQNTIARIQKDIDKSAKDERTKDIYSLFGLKLDDEAKAAIAESTQFALSQLYLILDEKIKSAEEAVRAADKEVAAAERKLDYELQARAQGYASSVEAAQKELDLAKRTQNKANADREKAVKAQQRLDAAQQASSLITAIADIWKGAMSMGNPIVGAIIGVATTALMLGAFAASKIKAAQATKEQTFGEGGVELLQGGSHASGNDIDLGMKKDGTRRRAEGGEYFAVINKRQSAKYRELIPDVVKALNNGTFESKYLKAYDTGNFSIMMNGESPDLRALSNDVSAIRNQNERRYVHNPDGSITMFYKNLTRRITA